MMLDLATELRALSAEMETLVGDLAEPLPHYATAAMQGRLERVSDIAQGCARRAHFLAVLVEEEREALKRPVDAAGV